MQSSLFRIKSLRLGIPALLLSLAAPAFAQAPGGFIEKAGSGASRPALSQSQIRNLLPQRGPFTFPAPYNTTGIRLTNANDCNGGDCVAYVGYSYWNNINNHVGYDSMLVLVGLEKRQGGQGPTLFEVDKRSGQVTDLGPIFPSNNNYSNYAANGWYFSRTMPTKIYINNTDGPRIERYDVFSGEFDTVFNIRDHLGSGYNLWQIHSSSDDRVHSATVKNSSWAMVGCMAYEEDTGRFHYFPKKGEYDECQIDKSGRYLTIKENVDGRDGEDNRIIDLVTGHERVLYDRDGAAGHSDTGYGYMIAADNWAGKANTQKFWDFTRSDLVGIRTYYNEDWSVQAPAHVSHTNARPDLAPDKQYACGSSANSRNSQHANEVICFRMDDSGDVLVVAPVLTDRNASGGGDSYAKWPKGNLDVTGEWFVWTTNMGGNRLDAFLVRVPGHLLTDAGNIPLPPGPSPDPGDRPEPEPQPEPEPEVQPGPAGLLGHWPLGDGSKVNDLSGHAFDGSLVGGARWESGALLLDGVDDYANIPHHEYLNTWPLSVAFWMKSGESGQRALINKYLPGSMNGYQVFLYDGQLCAWYFRDADNQVWDGSNCTLAVDGVNDNEWHHVVFTVDEAGGRLIVDGTQRASQAWTGTAGPASTTQDLRLGQYPGTSEPFLAGKLDEVRIYGNALDNATLKALLANQPGVEPDPQPEPEPEPEPKPEPEQPDLLTGLLSHWQLDGDAQDSSGNARHGSVHGGASWGSGRLAESIQLDGTGAFVEIPHQSALNGYPLSVAFWMKSTAQGQTALVNKYLPASMNGYQVFLYNGQLCAWYFRDSSNYVWDGSNCSLAVDGVTDGEWHHVVFTVGAQGAQLHVDGELAAERGWTGTAGASSSTQALSLGRYPGTSEPYMAGELDDVRLYGRVLDAEAIAALADGTQSSTQPPKDEAPALPTGLLALWPLDSDASDLSGNGLSGNVQGSPSWSQGPIGGALRFDGSDDYVEVAHRDQLNGYPLSLAFWMKSSDQGQSALINKYQAGSMNGYQVFLYNGQLCAWYFRDERNYVWDGSNCSLAVDGVTDGQWHHVVFTVDASGAQLHVDGKPAANRAWTGSAGATSTRQALSLGRYPDTAEPYLAGELDDVRVYDRVIDSTEIQSLASVVTPTEPPRQEAPIVEEPPMEEPPVVEEPQAPVNGALSWTDVSRLSTRDGALEKVSGCNGCPDAGAHSVEEISGDALLDFRVADTRPMIYIGLTANYAGNTANNIRYALRFQQGHAEVRESGSYRASTRFSAGDRFQVIVEDGQVSYARNGTVFHTSSARANFPLRVDTVFFTSNGRLEDLKLSTAR